MDLLQVPAHNVGRVSRFRPTTAAPPDPQPVQQPAQQAPPLLQEGYIQTCQGYLKRRTNILKRWKKQWFGIAPGEFSKSSAADP